MILPNRYGIMTKKRMKKTKWLITILLVIGIIISICPAVVAVNSYMGLWEHVPDGEPHVFGDRVYVYGSHDTFISKMCGPDYVVWSAPLDDLTNWKYEGVSFDGGTRGYLLAPDACQGPDGKYYLYFTGDCDQGGSFSTYVAVAEKPEGPFEYLGPVIENGKKKSLFDPAVLVDDDGKVYLFGASANIWELDPTDMRTIISETHQVQEVNAKGELQQIRDFQEGSSIRKVGDYYVFVYASRHDITKEWPVSSNLNTNYQNGTLEYAFSKNIYGPYTYGGVIIDNNGVDVETGSKISNRKSNYTGNTHGGICQVGDRWYVFYHRQTHADQTHRQAMCEPIDLTITNDAVIIKQAEMTSQGAEADGLKAAKEYSAGIACYLTNSAYIDTEVENQTDPTPVVNIKNSAVVGVKYINFEGGSYDIDLKIVPKDTDGYITVVLDDPAGKPIATIPVPSSEEELETLTASCGKISGKHAVYFDFYAYSKKEICEFVSFEFKPV